MFLTNPFAGAFGLDIGDGSLKLVQLQARHAWRGALSLQVTEARTIALPEGYVVNGQIEQPEMVRRKLLYLLGKEGRNKALPIPWVVTALPESNTFIRLVTLDMPAAEITAEDVRFQARKHFPFELDDYYLDWQPLPSHRRQTAKNSRVLVALAPKILADSYTYLLESVGLSPLALEIEAVAVARAVVGAANPPEEAVLLVHVGAHRATIGIMSDGVVQCALSSTFFGERITAAIAETLKMDSLSAETLKTTRGLRYDKKNPRYLVLLSKLAAEFIAELRQARDFYKTHFTSAQPITMVYLAGGGAALLGLDEAVARELKVPVHVADPWSGYQSAVSTSPAERTAFTLATGLARRAAANPLDAD